MEENDILIEVKDLKKYFPVKTGFISRTKNFVKAVDGLSFHIRKKETLGLVGESGCGKTTVGRTILRLLEATEGEVIFEGRNIFELGGGDLRKLRRNMQIIFQDPYGSLNPRLTVGNAVGEPLQVHGIARGSKKKKMVRKILERVGLSADYAADLGRRLRERIYNDVVPDLAMAIVQARRMDKPTAQDLATTYEMALMVLFRLLFIAYAEDKELLPYRTNDRYKTRSLKGKAQELAKLKRSGEVQFDDSATHWEEVMRLSRAINSGHREWGIPEYNGGLFSEEKDVSAVGSELAKLGVPNKLFGPILMSLLIDETLEGFGPVDFRSLGVREFGTIYEGLLESELSAAEVDLIVDTNGLYAPADGRTPVVSKGDVYLHNASGARKATGSYYTKHFAVEHLLNHSLEPALAEHIERLEKLNDRKAGEAFFDFRVADIAMGSGHFLIAAVDRIERRLSSYIAEHKLPVVTQELQRLRASAKEQLEKVGLGGEAFDIEDNLLLRRQIARRCVYGVDINPVAVQLARLSLWIHTFVPGLPLSFLDHNIVCGNSLVGIATFQEVSNLLDLSEGGLFAATAQTLIGKAEEAVTKLARLSDANAAEIKRARKAYEEERKAIAPTERMFNILTAQRIPESEVSVAAESFKEKNELLLTGEHNKARDFLKPMPPFHFPIAFPEVFLRG